MYFIKFSSILVVVLSQQLTSIHGQKEQTFVQEKSLLSCEELGWSNLIELGNGAVCSQIADGDNEVCSDELSIDDANLHCENMGARLCTVEELKNGIN